MTDNLEIEKTLWQAADKLHNNMDAAEYNEILFIDARELGAVISRKQKELRDKDKAINFNLAKIGYAL